LVQLTGVAQPAAAPACVCRLHTVAVRQAALVSDESALEACLRRCAIQIDDLLGERANAPCSLLCWDATNQQQLQHHYNHSFCMRKKNERRVTNSRLGLSKNQR